MKTTKSNSATATSEKNGEKLKELFVDALKDIYWAEKHLMKALPKLAKAATSEELKAAFESHLTETEGHVTKVEQVFEEIGEKAKAKHCPAMEGLIEEGQEVIESTDKGTSVRDCGLIMAAQKVEHYEIASYGSLRNLAGLLGYKNAAKLLQSILEEETAADEKLTNLAESQINEEALQE
ncbi:ferritin-like domain-containing protein [Emticicia sp. C21]|uniref:YciE/YciF ferroxidase family protein n=1 Tax=Emticicia sp. C21 TaxID=2302915 RepID=UPI000E355BC5|nr:ferritin-like domain-containing protein [Emticicia sp. C21]RFS15508.1 ferritin-like domain-containing protein [Emticicia sp. C21]